MNKALWIVGQYMFDKPWQFQGVFDTEQAAVKACHENYFVSPVVLNQELPKDSADWEGAYYPLSPNRMNQAMKKTPQLAETFRVYPSTGRHYAEVMVFPNLRAMRQYGNAKLKKEKRGGSGAYDAIFFPEMGADPKLPKECLGMVLFSKTRLSEGTISHELGHVAMHHSRRRRHDPGSEDREHRGESHEEVCIRALGKMVDEFHAHYSQDD